MRADRVHSLCAILFSSLSFVHPALGIDLTIDDEQSVKDASSEAIWGAMTFYHGNESGQIPGAFPEKWWEGSALLLAALNYWHFTGDDTYNEDVSVGLQWQGGDHGDYMPSNYSSYLGNDDQMFWGLSALTAAEYGFPDRKEGFSWLSLAQGTFNTMKARWDNESCGGGMRWQLFVYQGSGYTLKNAISNGGFFQLAARLAMYTQKSEYADWARKTWEWCLTTPMINNKTWTINDSTQGSNNCADTDHMQWSYNYGVFLAGAAYMYTFYTYPKKTNDSYWLEVVHGILGSIFKIFFPKGIMYDPDCEIAQNCNNNEVLFKGEVVTWMALTALMIPDLYDEIMPKLKNSAVGAAASCSGLGNNSCGVRWYQSKFDGHHSMEAEISSSCVLSVNMLPFVDRDKKKPLNIHKGGNSKSDPNAGNLKDNDDAAAAALSPITTGDKAGAAILTVAFIGGWLGLAAFMFIGA
ncbi:mannan endo-1-6-alpha-mannosidase [Penicillium chermesinum]|nr:mannan endo-1-6-alpha-mannosidase [Penicillium chermesinum]